MEPYLIREVVPGVCAPPEEVVNEDRNQGTGNRVSSGHRAPKATACFFALGLRNIAISPAVLFVGAGAAGRLRQRTLTRGDAGCRDLPRSKARRNTNSATGCPS
jgi:hypothetical protein